MAPRPKCLDKAEAFNVGMVLLDPGPQTSRITLAASDPLNWTVVLPVVVGALSIWYLLPSPQRRPILFGALGAIIAVAGVVAFLIRGLGHAAPATVEAGLFFGFAGMAITFAGLMIVTRNPARSALCFAMVVLSTCGLFLLNAAPFLAAATIIIYAGAIIVTFLFVIMLSQQTGLSNADLRAREPVLAVAAGFVVLATLLVGLQRVYNHSSVDAAIEKASTIARAEKIDPDLLSAVKPDGEAPTLTKKATEFLEQMRVALDRVKVAAPRRGEPHRYTDHRLVQDVETALNGLEILGFKSADVDDVRLNCQKISDGLMRLKELRDSPDSADLKLSPHAVVEPLDGGRKKLPAANVSAIGRAVFTDHLLTVELAGTLLLVATVGAIAIAGGRREKNK